MITGTSARAVIFGVMSKAMAQKMRIKSTTPATMASALEYLKEEPMVIL